MSGAPRRVHAVKKDRDISSKEELRANIRSVGIVLRERPWSMAALLVISAIGGIVPALIVERTGRFIDLIGPARAGDAIAEAAARSSLTVAIVALVGGLLLDPFADALRYSVARAYQAGLARRVMAGVTGVPGLAHFEDPEFRDRLEVSEWIGWAPVETLWMMVQTFSQTIQIISLAAVVGAFAGWAPWLIIGATVPAGVAAFHRVRAQGLAIWHDSPEMKHAGYHRRLAMELPHAKEIRIFGLRGFTRDRNHAHWLAGMAETWRQRQKGARDVLGLRAISLAAFAFTFIAMLRAGTSGRLAPGAFFAGATAATYLLTFTVGVFSTLAWMRRMNYLLPIVLRLMDLPTTDPRLEATGTRSAHGLARSGIAFEGVRFRYPGTDRWILDGVDLRIDAGASLALVGENGAGKTTLIKLLCRFYDPTEGRITLDGIDIREFDLDDYRMRLACIFQDFTKYELPARDNVGFGAVEHRMDTELLHTAAARVGIAAEIESLDDGWETPLSRVFDGADLSGGQWQRVALARAIFAQLGRDADILILDEPTASLDVRLEHELYEHFAEIAKGRTTLLVSHRFSTVRMAERIIVLEHGVIVEDGSHATLSTSGGRYATLYRMQAEHFQATGALE